MNSSGCVEKDFCIPHFTKNQLGLMSYAEVSLGQISKLKERVNGVNSKKTY